MSKPGTSVDVELYKKACEFSEMLCTAYSVVGWAKCSYDGTYADGSPRTKCRWFVALADNPYNLNATLKVDFSADLLDQRMAVELAANHVGAPPGFMERYEKLLTDCVKEKHDRLVHFKLHGQETFPGKPMDVERYNEACHRAHILFLDPATVFYQGGCRYEGTYADGSPRTLCKLVVYYRDHAGFDLIWQNQAEHLAVDVAVQHVGDPQGVFAMIKEKQRECVDKRTTVYFEKQAEPIQPSQSILERLWKRVRNPMFKEQ